MVPTAGEQDATWRMKLSLFDWGVNKEAGKPYFLAGVTELNGDWRIAVGGKMNSPTNIEFLKIDIHLWRKKNFDSQKFMQSSSSILLSQPLLKLAKLGLKITDL